MVNKSKEVVIASAIRTPIGTYKGGSFAVPLPYYG